MHASVGAPDHVMSQSGALLSWLDCIDASPDDCSRALKCSSSGTAGCQFTSVPVNRPKRKSRVFNQTRVANEAIEILRG